MKLNKMKLQGAYVITIENNKMIDIEKNLRTIENR